MDEEYRKKFNDSLETYPKFRNFIREFVHNNNFKVEPGASFILYEQYCNEPGQFMAFMRIMRCAFEVHRHLKKVIIKSSIIECLLVLYLDAEEITVSRLNSIDL